MRYVILALGIVGALVFLYSVYAFISQPEQFKTVAYVFLGVAIVFFVLVIIKKVRDEKEYRKKISSKDQF
jgi:predicted membrane channel-forming protein YqfA (hemolysin III family)